MPAEPATKRAVAFIDGQNLFYAVKYAFGYTFPNYDIPVLARSVCAMRGWTLEKIYFYTGIPKIDDDKYWNHFWTKKLAFMGTRGVKTFSRKLKYRNQTVRLPGGGSTTVLVGQEKGIDVRLALDVVRLARESIYDVGVVFSQDQDLSEVADELKAISIQQNRWIKLACAFPVSPTYTNRRGIANSDWVKFDRTLYDGCIDPIDYRVGLKP